MNLASLRPHLNLWGLRSAWALAIVLWALALVPWFKTPPPPVTATATVPSRAAVAPKQGTQEPAEEIIEPTEPARPRSALAAEPAAPPLERGARDGAVCGLNDGAAGDAPSPALKAAHVARQANLGLQQAFDALRTQAAAPAQAAAWWLRVLLAREADPAALSAPCAAGGADCATAAALPTPAAAVDALAQLAQSSNDAWVQQVAQRACDGVTSAACSSLGPRRWTTLQPDNAAAWLELAARDPQSVDEALFRAARATRFDAQRGALAAQVLQAAPEQAPVMQRHAAWQRADELERAADAKTAAAAARACNDAARRDANRDQLCDGAARWLAQLRPAGGDAAAVAGARALDCATLERQWREARDAAQGRGAVQATAGTRP